MNNPKLYLRPVYAQMGQASLPVQRVCRVEVVGPDEEVLGELPVTDASVESNASDPAKLSVSTFRFFMGAE